MADEALRVTVAVATAPDAVVETPVSLAAGSSVRQALAAAGCTPACADAPADVGIWGHAAGLEAVLRDGDRVEVYRPLQVDPKRARRERFQQQGVRATGLFVRQRKGAKPGY